MDEYDLTRTESNGTKIFISSKKRRIFFEAEAPDKIFPLDTPIQVDFEITQKCNLTCSHCYLKSKKESYTKKTWQVLENMIEEGVLMFELSGGEPLIHPNLSQAASRLAGNALPVARAAFRRWSGLFPAPSDRSCQDPPERHRFRNTSGIWSISECTASDARRWICRNRRTAAESPCPVACCGRCERAGVP